MKEPLAIRVLRKVRISLVRKLALRYFYKKHGLALQNFFSYYNDRFYIYQVENKFIPNESLFWPCSYNSQLEKCRNESLVFYQPRPGDTVIDIGAGLGEETIYYSDMVGETGRVISIEASPVVFEMLKKTVSLNQLTNVDIYNVAITNEDGPVTIAGVDYSYEEGFIEKAGGKTGESIVVHGTRINNFLEKHAIEKIDFLKVNIEGAERYVIDGLEPAQLAGIKHVAIACHDFRYRKEGNIFFQTKDYVSQFLQLHGFEVQTRQTGTAYLDDWVYGRNKF